MRGLLQLSYDIIAYTTLGLFAFFFLGVYSSTAVTTDFIFRVELCESMCENNKKTIIGAGVWHTDSLVP